MHQRNVEKKREMRGKSWYKRKRNVGESQKVNAPRAYIQQPHSPVKGTSMFSKPVAHTKSMGKRSGAVGSCNKSLTADTFFFFCLSYTFVFLRLYTNEKKKKKFVYTQSSTSLLVIPTFFSRPGKLNYMVRSTKSTASKLFCQKIPWRSIRRQNDSEIILNSLFRCRTTRSENKNKRASINAMNKAEPKNPTRSKRKQTQRKVNKLKQEHEAM